MVDTLRDWEYFLGTDPDGNEGAFSNDENDPEITSQNVRDLTYTLQSLLSDSTSMTVTAGEDLSALRAVVIIDNEAFAADSTDVSHFGKVVGITSTAASAGNGVTVKVDGGRIEDAGLSLTGGLVYFGSTGALTQVVPASGFAQSVAVSTASDSIVVQLGDPIRRT